MSDPVTVTSLLAEPEFNDYTRERFISEHTASIITDFVGRPAINRDDAKRILDVARAERQRLAEARAERAAETRERIDAIRRRQPSARGGVPATPGSSALADMLAVDRR